MRQRGKILSTREENRPQRDAAGRHPVRQVAAFMTASRWMRQPARNLGLLWDLNYGGANQWLASFHSLKSLPSSSRNLS